MIGELLLHTGHITPLFFSLALGKTLQTPVNSTYCYTISTLNQYFGQNIMAQSTNVQSVSMGDGNSHCGNIVGSFNNTVYRSDDGAEIMRWLSPLEPSSRHQGLRTERFAGVGDWLLEREEFREWKGGRGEADKAVLFCYGDPGVGKTYLRLVAGFFQREKH